MSSKTDLEKAFPKIKQVGGDHYKNFKIQPWSFIRKNNLNPFQANVIKYVCRYENKNKEQDIEKIIHYCELELEHMKKDNNAN